MSRLQTPFPVGTIREAPVHLVRAGSGKVVPFGRGASSDSERGAALVAALQAWSNGDSIELTPGHFQVPAGSSPTLTLGDNDVLAVRGAGIDKTTISRASGTSAYVFLVEGSSESVFQDLSFGSTYAVYYNQFTGVSYANNVGNTGGNGFDIDNGSGTIYWNGGHAGRGINGYTFTGCKVICSNVEFENVGFGSNIYEGGDLNEIIFLNCKTEGLEFIGAPGVLRLRGTHVEGNLDDDEGWDVYMDAATVVTGSISVFGTLHREPLHGAVPTSAGLALLSAASAAVQRTALGLGHTIAVHATGTSPEIPGSYGQLTFGTTSPQITINQPGKYLILADAIVDPNDVGDGITMEFKLRRTNNTAADLANSTRYIEDGSANFAGGAAVDHCITLPPVIYETANSNDAIGLWAIGTNTVGNGVIARAASITAVRLA